MQNAANKRRAAQREELNKSKNRQAGRHRQKKTDRQTDSERKRERGVRGEGQLQQQQDAKIIKHTRKYDNARLLLKLLQSETRQCKTTNESQKATAADAEIPCKAQ